MPKWTRIDSLMTCHEWTFFDKWSVKLEQRDAFMSCEKVWGGNVFILVHALNIN